ncbi:MAG: DUF4403 family protein [Cyclobacteriaceae bacterium]|nr:DUF4403 family protein [Cyclobacteriaceae bacterium]
MAKRKVVLFVLILAAMATIAWWYYSMRNPSVKPTAPQRSTLDSALQVPISTLRIPLGFSVKDLETTVNKKLSGTFLQEWMAVGDKKKDSIYLALERFDLIKLDWQPGLLAAEIPVRIDFKFMKKAAGIRIANDKPVTAEVVVRLKSKVMLDDHWGLNTTTRIDTVLWKMEPTLKIVFMNVNLRGLADKYLARNQEKLTHRFDSLMHEVIDSRQVAEKIWADIHKPIIIKKTEPQVGLVAKAEALSSRWNPQHDGNISATVTLKTRVYSWFEQPPAIEPQPLPRHRYAPNQEEELDLYVHTRLPFYQINAFVNRNLNKMSLKYNSYVLNLHHAELYGSGQELALELRVRGALRGKIYFKALPYYDTLTQVIGLTNLRYDLNTEEALLNTADWMMHDNLVAILADTVKKDLTEELGALPQLIEGAIARGKSGNKLKLTVDSLAITSHASLITAHDIQWVLRARGRAGIALKKKILEGKK